MVGGVSAVRRLGRHALLGGPGVGAVLFLLLLTAGLLVYDGATVANGGLGILCACLCGGAIPGILGRKPRKKRRRGLKFSKRRGIIPSASQHSEEEIPMKHIQTLNGATLKASAAKGGCGECQTSCQSACKTSCTVANQKCENQ